MCSLIAAGCNVSERLISTTGDCYIATTTLADGLFYVLYRIDGAAHTHFKSYSDEKLHVILTKDRIYYV